MTLVSGQPHSPKGGVLNAYYDHVTLVSIYHNDPYRRKGQPPPCPV